MEHLSIPINSVHTLSVRLFWGDIKKEDNSFFRKKLGDGDFFAEKNRGGSLFMTTCNFLRIHGATDQCD